MLLLIVLDLLTSTPELQLLPGRVSLVSLRMGGQPWRLPDRALGTFTRERVLKLVRVREVGAGTGRSCLQLTSIPGHPHLVLLPERLSVSLVLLDPILTHLHGRLRHPPQLHFSLLCYLALPFLLCKPPCSHQI